MKRNYYRLFGGAIMGLLSFMHTAMVIVLSVVLEPLFSVKTFALLCGRTLSDFALMMFVGCASGAVFIGNKVFGTMAVTACDVDVKEFRRLYA